MSKRTFKRLSIRKETLRRLDSAALSRVFGGAYYGGASTTCATMGGASGGCATETLDCTLGTTDQGDDRNPTGDTR